MVDEDEIRNDIMMAISEPNDIEFTEEAADAAGPDQFQCPMCACTAVSTYPTKSRKMKFVRVNKDELCHMIHMIFYGEMMWSETWMLQDSQKAHAF